MSKIIRFKVAKLVRNRTIERLENKGVKCIFRTLEKDEFLVCLKEKLVEEAKEVFDAKNKQELASELADVLEVIHSLAKAHDFEFEDIDALRMDKLNERGSFEHRIYMEEIKIEDDNQAIEYYRENLDKYPEIK